MKQIPKHILKYAKKIKYLFLDVDGVLTDGKLYFGKSGEELKVFNVKDGQGIRLLQDKGIKVGIISARKSDIVTQRANELNISPLFQGEKDKASKLKEFIMSHSLKLDQIAFLGDDLPDLRIIKMVGLGLCVADSSEQVIKSADWKTENNGGHGAVREVAELILTAQEKLSPSLDEYL